MFPKTGGMNGIWVKKRHILEWLSLLRQKVSKDEMPPLLSKLLHKTRSSSVLQPVERASPTNEPGLCLRYSLAKRDGRLHVSLSITNNQTGVVLDIARTSTTIKADNFQQVVTSLFKQITAVSLL
jgi:hypothetical protein